MPQLVLHIAAYIAAADSRCDGACACEPGTCEPCACEPAKVAELAIAPQIEPVSPVLANIVRDGIPVEIEFAAIEIEVVDIVPVKIEIITIDFTDVDVDVLTSP